MASRIAVSSSDPAERFNNTQRRQSERLRGGSGSSFIVTNTSRTDGCDCLICRAASSPFRSGIDRSSTTTSGLSSLTAVNSARRRPPWRRRRIPATAVSERLDEHRMVVGDDDARFAHARALYSSVAALADLAGTAVCREKLPVLSSVVERGQPERAARAAVRLVPAPQISIQPVNELASNRQMRPIGRHA